jgi:alkylated DNA repair protein alkB family protein 7
MRLWATPSASNKEQQLAPALAMSLCRRFNIRRISSFVTGHPPRDFQYFPEIFSLAEQKILLSAALKKLDATETRLFRKRKKALDAPRVQSSPQDLFFPDDHYQFEEA